MSSSISVFDMLKIGVGPSSSHTLGPWLAARKWVQEIEQETELKDITEINIYFFGSLALTGKGHYSDKAVLFGLMDLDPETVNTENLETVVSEIRKSEKILLKNKVVIAFNPDKNIVLLKDQSLPFHPNGMKFTAKTKGGNLIVSVFYSVGGGFISKGDDHNFSEATYSVPFQTKTASDLANHCIQTGKSISDIVLENEKVRRPVSEIVEKLINIWKVMLESAYLGCHTEGILPGGLQVKRRAFNLNKELIRRHDYKNPAEWLEAMKEGRDFRKVITRISCIALAVNEVNASMGRIVTAPTNGSAGVIPAVLIYYICFSGQTTSDEDIVRFLLTAAEIGKYFKTGATISAAAGGCQAEIGVSSSMAAAALTERLGGTAEQALMAAEIAAEHHLGLTCDPVGGLVQIPCIERNSMGAVKAVTASMIALSGDPSAAKVSLDNVIKTMKEISADMNTKYKETSLGGLAVNVGVNIPEC